MLLLQQQPSYRLIQMDRRSFLKQSTAAGISSLIAAPYILTSRRMRARTAQGELIFKAYFVQKGDGPHLGTVEDLQNIGEKDWKFPQWALTTDEHWDTFYSNNFAQPDGVRVSDVGGKDKFGVNVRWNVEGFGFIYMTADNGGEFYNLPAKGESRTFNLNYELAKSRVAKNTERLHAFRAQGYTPSSDVNAFLDLSDEFYEAATRAAGEEPTARNAQKALYYAM